MPRVLGESPKGSVPQSDQPCSQGWILEAVVVKKVSGIVGIDWFVGPAVSGCQLPLPEGRENVMYWWMRD